MNQHLLKAGEKFAPKEGNELARLPCLCSWFRTGSAIVLHLTNGTLQINFFNDHIKLILCPHLGAAKLIDREKKLGTFKLEFLEKHGFDGDLRSRLKYAEGMIERLMTKTNVITKSEVSSASGQAAWSSGDLDSIDSKSPKSLSEILQRVADVISNAIRICLAIPPLLVLIAPFFLLNFLYLRFYLRGARQLNRLSSLQRSFLIAKFRETIQGVTSIRVFKMVNSEIAEFSRFVDGVTICNFASFGSSRWLEIRLELLSNSTIFLVVLFGIFMSRASAISPALLGLCITSAMAITERLYLGIKAFGHLETEAVSIERIYEYTKLPSEKPWKNDFEPPRNWPQNGGIIWSDYSAKYRPNLSLSLKNVNVSVKPGEKIAVIGRTGSGKSSLSLSLYRIFESAAGRILIDDIDISTLGLHDIRKKLTIIPQDPMFFSGTIRFNLDPFKKFDDEKIWEALEKCQLKKCFAESAEKLEYKIEEEGNNMRLGLRFEKRGKSHLSMGQRQFIFLGRALLRKAKILILDEATASCDPNTDRLIQEVIRRNFADSSVLTIAHRLETVSDYDKVMVFSHGEIVEFDQAERLLANPDSFYTKMLRSYYRSE
ncbi:unnamed protein product, partial [Mesorhabditis belari]|uniref:Uncharacterized protein n=1 Tax=Mesorhabditis belari TaxID=2138241 RepID=A0AAF3FJ68_9BILA